MGGRKAEKTIDRILGATHLFTEIKLHLVYQSERGTNKSCINKINTLWLAAS
tara:strand:+ start:558 stop:713 length:156 start_codon:yes stop_codon:yes gene_type:complete